MNAPATLKGPGGVRIPDTPENRAYLRAQRALDAAAGWRVNLEATYYALAGKRVRIVFDGKGSRTNGELVFLTPPVALGDQHRHQRNVCDELDDDGHQLCRACAVEEQFMVSAVHELGHITQGSFEAPDPETVAWFVDNAVAEYKVIYTHRDEAWIRERIMHLIAERTSAMALASITSPWLPGLVNALEDARVNARVHEARPGTQRMFEAKYHQIMDYGFDSMDGTHQSWSERDPSSQAMIGALLVASGYNDDLDFQRWFAPEVCAVLAEPSIVRLCQVAAEASTAGEVLNLAYELLEEFQARGFMPKTERERAREPEPEPEPEDSDEQPDEDDGDDDTDTDQGDPCEDGEPSGESGQGAGAADEQADEGDDTDQAEGEPSAGAGGEGEVTTDTGDGALAGDSDDTSDDENTTGDGDASEPEDGSDGAAGDDSAGNTSDGSDAVSEPESGAGGPSEPEPEPMSDEDIEAAAKRALDDLRAASGHADDIDDSDPDDPEAIDPAEHPRMTDEDTTWAEANPEIDRVVAQGWFASPSMVVGGLNILRPDADPYSREWHRPYLNFGRRAYARIWSQDHVDRLVMTSLGRARMVFSANKAIRMTRNLPAGRVDGPRAGRKLLTGDPAIFKHRQLPTAQSYSAIIGIDVSGSTASGVLPLMVAAAYGQAELFHRLKLPFAVYAHTAADSLHGGQIDVDLIEIKRFDEPWDDKHRNWLANLEPCNGNLDGHTLEYYRKLIERRRENHRFILYYTDGEMPASNYYEEREVLERECRYIKNHPALDVLAVGAGTNSPTRYGLDTVVINSIDDLPLVIKGLEHKLTGGR